MTVSSLRRLLTPYDVALGLLILVAGVLSVQWVAAAGIGGAGTLRVEIDGRIVKEVTFRASDPPRQITVDAPRGPVTVEISGGKARILPLPATVCPLGICWHSGWTSHPAKAIVCLPNRLVLRISHASGQVDGVTR